jgi:signal transduction histidine kinase
MSQNDEIFPAREPKKAVIVVFVVATLFFMLVNFIEPFLYAVHPKEHYLPFHTTAESFSIIVSFAIFLVAWFTYPQTGNTFSLFLGCSFLLIGLTDFFHAMTYPGMPGFIVESSPQNTLVFWLLSRLSGGFMILCAASIHPDSKSKFLNPYFLLGMSTLLPLLYLVSVKYFPEYYPAFIIEGKGLTPIKVCLEYVVIVLSFSAAWLYWKRFKKEKAVSSIYIISGLIITVLSELSFTEYFSLFDTYAILGHLYKIAAYYLFLKGIFIASVRSPYAQLFKAQLEVRKAHSELQELYRSLEEKVRERTRELEEALKQEKKLREEISVLAKFPETNPNMVFRCDESGNILYMNPTAEETLRSLGLKTEDLFTPEFKEIVKSTAGSDTIVRDVEKELRDKVFSFTFRSFKDEKNVFITGIDITERKRVERELRDARDKLEEKVKERTKELEDSRDALLNVVEDLEESKKELENTYKKLQVAYEELQELERLKADIIANVSHELRTPIAIAKGAISLAMEEKDETERRELLKKATKALARQNRIVEDLITVARVERRELKLDLKPMNLRELIRECVEESQGFALQRKVHIDVELKDLPQIVADRQNLKRVLLNLLDNAIKFNREGGKVRVRAEKKNGIIEISIRDTGIGIAEKDYERIFKPLTQLDPSTTREYGGTGMGLATAKKIVELHGGRIWVESVPGKGSEFHFTLPMKSLSG